MRTLTGLLIVVTALWIVQPLYAQSDTLVVNDVQREYQLHIPRNVNAPAPLLIVLHGGGGNGRQIRRFTGFDRIANQESFIVVYPEGLDNAWNDGRIFENSSTADDVAFIGALIDHLIATQPVDPARIYATGISNGGFMAYRLACELSDRIAGVAPLTATLSEDLAATCSPARPIRMLVINGTADPLVPYDGGTVTLPPNNLPRGQVHSTADTLRFWADHNQCDPEPVVNQIPDTSACDQTTARIEIYTNCQQPTQLITIIDGGHTWPGRAQYLPVRLIGHTNRDIDASQTIWDFFAGNE